MSYRELPRLDEQRCTGTGDCVRVCPTDCLELRRGAPVLARPFECVSCGLCAAVCPTDAIRLERTWVG